jgi:hypothetical protein
MSVDLEIGEGGVTPELLTKSASMPPVDAKTYEFQIEDVKMGNTAEGRPRMMCMLKILNDANYPNRSLIYSCVLPWIDPATGAWDISGGFTIVNLMKGTGKTWTGDLRKPEVQQAYAESLKGATGFMRVGQKPNRLDPSMMDNTVQIVAAKR